MNCCILLVGIIISIMGCKNSNTGNDTEMPIVFSEQNNAEIETIEDLVENEASLNNEGDNRKGELDSIITESSVIKYECEVVGKP